MEEQSHGSSKRPRDAPVTDEAIRPERASGEEYAKALSSMISAAEAKEVARQRRSSSPGSRSALLVLMFMLFAAVAWNVYAFLRPVQPPPPETQLRAGWITVFNAVRAIEAYREARGSLPSNLSVLNIPRGDYEYARSDTGYTLQLGMPDVVVTFRSGDDINQLLVQAGVR